MTAIVAQSQPASLPSLPERGLCFINDLTIRRDVAEAGWGRLPTQADKAKLSALLAVLEARSRPPTDAEIVLSLTRLANHFPRERDPGQWRMLLEDYLRDLEGFSAGDIERSIVDHRRSKRFFPTISELVELGQVHKAQREFALKRVRQLLEVCA
jgi:hypothetical protein